MKPKFYRPPGALAGFVEYFWTFDWREQDSVRTLRMFATGVSGILLQHHDGRPALGARAERPVGSGRCPTLFVYGKRTRPAQTSSNGPFQLTGVVFKPQGLRMLFEANAMEFNDGSAGLGDFSRDRLDEQLLNAASDRERVARLTAFLRQRADRAGAEDPLVTESLALMRRDIHSVRVPRLLKCLGASERQLERRFLGAIGLSPHQYIRILRFRKAVQLMRERAFRTLTDVACELSYVDQSHFIKDIKAFSGFTPGRLMQTIHAGVDLPCALIERPLETALRRC